MAPADSVGSGRSDQCRPALDERHHFHINLLYDDLHQAERVRLEWEQSAATPSIRGWTASRSSVFSTPTDDIHQPNDIETMLELALGDLTSP